LKFPIFKRAFLFVATLVALAGCKENTILGTDVVPSGDTINTISVPDTLQILARSVYDDSVSTSYLRLVDNNTRLVGAALFTAGTVTSDPVFGKTFAGIAFQPAASGANFTFGNNPRIDSVVLQLPYTGTSWGDTLSAPALRFRVYQMAEVLSKDSLYRASRVPAVDRSQLWGEKEVFFNDLKDSVFVQGARRAPHVRIRLDGPSFLPALNAAIAQNSTVPAFVEAFKGLYIEADASRGSFLPYFNFQGGLTEYQRAGITVYYGNSANPDSGRVSFFFNKDFSGIYNYIRRDYTGTPAYNALFGAASDPSLLYLQSKPGASIDIRFPNLSSLPVAVYNRASLTLTQIDTGGTAAFFPPNQLLVTKINEDGSQSSIADRLPESNEEGAAFVDGRLRTVLIGGVIINQYIINFPLELQRTRSAGKDALHLRLNATTNFPGAFRLLAGGRTAANWKVKVAINYSRP
jgi:hypothetical protein